MAVRPRYIKLEESSNTDPSDRSPVVSLLYLSGQGIVFKSLRNFDTGIKLAIGLHLDKIRDDLGLSKTGSLFDLNPFLDVQGFVADCKMMEVTADVASYQVTLLFDGLDEADEMLVESIERELRSRNHHPVLNAPPRHEAGLN
ncbi:MAG: hypothetical protein ACI9UA_005400 [Pseudoalteromonas tetraodonis]|jgi:hypothetical protein